MEVDPSIRIRVLPGVYPPSTDSYILIESLDVEGSEKVLDMGCGTGIISLHLAKKGCEVVAVDIDERAVENTILNAKLNNVAIKVFKSNLFDKIKEKFDIIVFNPPYLPTKGENISWDGGEGGIEILDRFLENAWKFLRKRGKIYIVASSLTNIDLLMEKYGDIYSFDPLKKTHIFFEDIVSYLITLRSNKSLYP